MEQKQPYKPLSFENDITPPRIFTLTVAGSFIGLNFDEKEVMNDPDFKPTGYIAEILSNYGTKTNPAIPKPPEKPKSAQGRKKKVKKESTRKKQGTGDHLNCSISIIVVDPDNPEKRYHCTCFRKQSFKLLGTVDESLGEAKKIVNIVRDFYAGYKPIYKDIQVQSYLIEMLDCNCNVINTDVRLILGELNRTARKYQILSNPACAKAIISNSTFHDAIKDKLIEYLSNLKIIIFQIQEGQKANRGSSLNINVVHETKKIKKQKSPNLMMVKIYPSGKINYMHGGTSKFVHAVNEIIRNMILFRENETCIDPDYIENAEDPDTSDCSLDSLYLD